MRDGRNPFREEHAPGGAFVVQYAGRLGEKHTLEPLIDAACRLQDSTSGSSSSGTALGAPSWRR